MAERARGRKKVNEALWAELYPKLEAKEITARQAAEKLGLAVQTVNARLYFTRHPEKRKKSEVKRYAAQTEAIQVIRKTMEERAKAVIEDGFLGTLEAAIARVKTLPPEEQEAALIRDEQMARWFDRALRMSGADRAQTNVAIQVNVDTFEQWLERAKTNDDVLRAMWRFISPIAKLRGWL